MSEHHPSTHEEKQGHQGPRQKRRWGVVLGVLLLLCLLAALAPWIVANTPLRNPALNWALDSDALEIEADGAELGWTTPLALRDVVVINDEDDFRMSMPEMAFAESWLDLWQQSPNLGELTLVEPRIDMAIPRLVPEQIPGETTPITFAAEVSDASIRLRAPDQVEPVLDAEEVDLQFRIEDGNKTRLLYVEPTQFLDHYEVTEEACDEGLQLVAPILADVGRVKGKMSLSLTSFRMPLDEVDTQTRRNLVNIEGRLQLHEVVAGLRNPVLQEALSNLGALFGFDLPSEVHIADDTEIDFLVRNGRVHHESLFFLLPEVTGDKVWKSRGSVGLDESLDLVVDAPMPIDQVYENELTKRLSQQRIELHIGGTISEPEIRLPDDCPWLAEMAEAAVGDGVDSGDPIDQFMDQAAVVIEGGEMAYDLWKLGRQWWLGEDDPAPPDAEQEAPSP